MHIIPLPLVHDRAQLTNRSAHHIQSSHLDRTQTSPTHGEHTPVRSSNLPATRFPGIRVDYVHPAKPGRHHLGGQLYVCSEDVAKGGPHLVAQQHHSVVVATANFQPPLPSASQVGILTVEQTSLHTVRDQLHPWNLAPVDKCTLGTLELKAVVVAVLVYRSILREQRLLYAIALRCLVAAKSLQPIGIMPLRAPRNLRVVP